MKKYLLPFLTIFVFTNFMYSQAYEGRGDQKFQVGANFQENGTGITASYDYGLGENISVGAVSTYLLGIASGIDDDTRERFDAKVRFSAHLGPIIDVSPAFDIYPGLDLGLKNFGFHTGARYFFSEGLGVYTEFGFPIAKYQTEDLTLSDKFHNQFNVNIGVSFNFL
ncbi:hypothetical protein D1013_19775 [Euzebyella marina]|uniref:Porin family protein n=1 Tax=Euzebyella marina TaxID=1761453 RepID=A0A3G2LB25_9FLAO|nr:DUF6646 family protein [Euzebyella marina]AYN69459.1 hypothetical protein D1013_19775 [Euzebyella marina]MAU71415.1 hypothetical protein [Pseudozobellia sp.]MBG46815.1 hypothetical protein [Pseudozobellia sp.]|tara:strand:- start:652 stop:1152 length:501 start_codon:yes stop_codon:yes gene_type:complete